jgi:hypothetical protein
MEKALFMKRCSKCRIRKRSDLFGPDRKQKDGLFSWCRVCKQLDDCRYRRTDRYREARAAYRARPEVKEADRRRYRERPDADAEKRREYGRSLRGRLVGARGKARRQLLRATNPARIAALKRLIADYERELARFNVVYRPRRSTQSSLVQPTQQGG